MTNAEARPLLITGVPAAGKSSFLRYLRKERGYRGFILEEIRSTTATDDEADVRSLWERAVHTGEASSFVSKLRDSPRPTIVEWGFPINELCIRCVESMTANGMRLLWFECPDTVARDRFLERDTVPVSAFDIQVPQIRCHYDTIISRLRPEIVEVAPPGGSPRTFAELADQIGV